MTHDPRPATERITSSANERLKRTRRLGNSREREQRGTFVIEGFRELQRALDGEIRLIELYLARELWKGPNEQLVVDAAVARGTDTFNVAAEAFMSIAAKDRPDGLLAVAEQFPTDLGRQARPTATSLFVIAEGIERPGNLGTLIRTSCAAGVTGLVVCEGQADVFHPDVLRSSVGTVFSLPISVTNSESVVTWAEKNKIRLIVTSPDGPLPYWGADYLGPTAIVVGGEKRGVTNHLLHSAHDVVCIPVLGSIDSINVAVAAGVVMFEAIRQRWSQPVACQ